MAVLVGTASLASAQDAPFALLVARDTSTMIVLAGGRLVARGDVTLSGGAVDGGVTVAQLGPVGALRRRDAGSAQGWRGTVLAGPPVRIVVPDDLARLIASRARDGAMLYVGAAATLPRMVATTMEAAGAGAALPGDGPLGLVVPADERMARIVRGGRQRLRAPIAVRNPHLPLGANVYQLLEATPDGRMSWLALPLVSAAAAGPESDRATPAAEPDIARIEPGYLETAGQLHRTWRPGAIAVIGGRPQPLRTLLLLSDVPEAALAPPPISPAVASTPAETVVAPEPEREPFGPRQAFGLN